MAGHLDEDTASGSSWQRTAEVTKQEVASSTASYLQQELCLLHFEQKWYHPIPTPGCRQVLQGIAEATHCQQFEQQLPDLARNDGIGRASAHSV